MLQNQGQIWSRLLIIVFAENFLFKNNRLQSFFFLYSSSLIKIMIPLCTRFVSHLTSSDKAPMDGDRQHNTGKRWCPHTERDTQHSIIYLVPASWFNTPHCCWRPSRGARLLHSLLVLRLVHSPLPGSNASAPLWLILPLCVAYFTVFLKPFLLLLLLYWKRWPLPRSEYLKKSSLEQAGNSTNLNKET